MSIAIILNGIGTATSFLFAERRDFTGFHLRVEARVGSNAGAGVTVRAVYPEALEQFRSRCVPGYLAKINADHARCAKLKSLKIPGDKITAAQIAALQQALPNCKIEGDEAK